MTSEAWIAVAAAAALVLATRRRRRRVVAATDPARPANLGTGIDLADDGLSVRDWNQWMKGSPPAFVAALQESDDPAEIVANTFRRLYQNVPWPPDPDTEAGAQWSEIVASVGRSLQRPFPGHLRVVS
jgi:hypothetical protein